MFQIAIWFNYTVSNICSYFIILFQVTISIYWYCNILICRCVQKHIQHNKDEWTQFFRKIYLSLYLKGFERVTKVIICERRVGDWKELQHIDPHSSGHSSISFPFSWAAQPGTWEPSFCWDMVLIPVSSLQLIWTSCRRGYIIIWCPPTSCERHICTQFNLSTVKVIPWSPDIFDRMHLLFTQVHFSSDSPAGSEVNMLQYCFRKLFLFNYIVSSNCFYFIILFLGRCPWCNGYRRRIWTRRHEFKSWTTLIAFHISLIPLGKV